jgi:hypothetical protein
MTNAISAITTLLLSLLAASAFAAESAQDTQQDIARHRAIAAAHTAAAECRAAGKGEELCGKELQAACKGIAIGKYCGMKHEH